MSLDPQHAPPKNIFTREISPVALKLMILILFLLVFFSLGLNWYLITQLLQARQQALGLVQEFKPVAQDTLEQVDSDLADFQTATFEFQVEIDQQLPIAAEIPFNETIDVPIKATIPIKQQIQTTIMLDPFQAGLEIPTDIDVPVEVEVPIDMVVPVKIERTVPISTVVPINLDVPVIIDIGDTELVGYIEKLRQGLDRLNASLEQATLE